MEPIYDIIHNGEHYTVYQSCKLLSLSAFPKEFIKVRKEHSENTIRIKGEISELKNFSKICGGKHIYELIMSNLNDLISK